MPAYPDYPSMFVACQDIRDRRQYFLDHKLNKLKGKVSVPDFMAFTPADFKTLLLKAKHQGYDVFRLFFAVDDLNTLTIIFAPAFENVKETEYYRLTSNNEFKFLDTDTADEWTDNYEENILPLFDGTYDQDANSPSDTKHLYYYIDDLLQINDEIDYQCTPNDRRPGFNITKIRLLFSSYTDKDKDKSHNHYKITDGIIHKRCFTELMLVENKNGNDDEFYIDKQDDFRHRSRRSGRMGFDTGNLCPPKCNG
jgi:hypothetical protein